jgi:hypothetical protein
MPAPHLWAGTPPKWRLTFYLPQKEGGHIYEQIRAMEQRKEPARRKHLLTVHESMLALHEALKSGDKDTQQLLALTTRLDALLRHQDRLQRVIERAREPQQENAKPRAADAELIAELERRGL